MPRTYTQLSLEERETIHQLLHEQKSLREIARVLGRSHSTLCRELAQHKAARHNQYTPHLAQARTEVMRRERGSRPRLKEPRVRRYVEEHLRVRWSPEQIAGRIERDLPGLSISPEAIYQYIYQVSAWREGYGPLRVGQEDFRRYLRRRHKRRRRKNLPYQPRHGPIRNRVSIEVRPSIVARRCQLGHWEGDRVESSEHRPAGLNTLVERVSGLVRITKLAGRGAAETRDAVVARLGVLPATLRRTLTLDNGFENAEHEIVTQQLGTRVYFAHPHCSWERGSNENTNGLIRDYLPKGTDFANVSAATIATVEQSLNTRPRKRHHYLTPLEVLVRRGALKR